MTTALAHRDLADLEEVIGRGLNTFVEVGQALVEIRDRRLYRLTHDTFEAYCRERWDFSRIHAHRFIEAADIVGVLPIGNSRPSNESQARALAPLKDDPEQMAEAWEEAIVETNGKPTAAAVTEAVERRLRKPLTEAEQAEEDRQGAIRRAQARLASLVDGWIELVQLPENPDRAVLLDGLIEHDRRIVLNIEALYLRCK